MAKQLAFYFDASACIGCKTCQVACQDKNNLSAGMKWRRVFDYGGGGWLPKGAVMVPSNVYNYYVSTACMHCEQPICADVCPSAAITKRDDGVVLIDQDKCIGCRYCEWACPYGAPVFDEAKGVMTKCTFCEDLLAQGQEPACVASCPLRALEFGELDELRAKHGNVDAIEPLPEASLTRPAVVIALHKHAQLSGTWTGSILSLPEEV
jgi:anaerobic dimethyl sulfoxide reductase subunit B (iron-sulfur subunit)